MGYQIQTLIDILLSQNGYLEKSKNCPKRYLYEKLGPYVGGDNWTMYWQDLADAGLANYQGSYYCIATIFWGMVKAYGLEAAQRLCLQKFMINCQETYNLFKGRGQVHASPLAGDIAVFWNGKRFHHAELVISVKGDTYKTFGANTSVNAALRNGGGCYAPKYYSAQASKAAGHKFLRPRYGPQQESGWLSTGGGWKYRLGDGSLVRDAWRYIDGRYYAFDGSGTMITGWFYSEGQWYYLCGDGGMAQGWQKADKKWYYLEDDGAMRQGWLQDGDAWYYLDTDGVMTVGWRKIEGIWYVFSESGKMISESWFPSAGKWYYLSSTGAMATEQWRQDKNGEWYYLTGDGSMGKNGYVRDKYREIYYFVDENGVYDPRMDAGSPDAGHAVFH